MRFWPIAAAALVALETAAIACSCLATTDPVQLKSLATDAAEGAVALVEVETVVTYAQSNGAGDRMRVVRTLAGSAPEEFRVERGHMPSSASCDLLFEKGERDIVILYPAQAVPSNGKAYRISSLCTAHMLDQPAFRDEVERLIEARTGSGERG